MQAFRRLSREKHPDKNRHDIETSTRDYQVLTQAKLVLLDAEMRKKYDGDLVDSGARNQDALPLLCNICAGAIGRHAKKCLKGFGHKNPLIEEYYTTKQEYNDRIKGNWNEDHEKKKFANCFFHMLQQFKTADWIKLYALASIPDKTQCEDLPIPEFVERILKDCSPASEIPASRISATKPFVPSPADVKKLFDASLLRQSTKTTAQSSSISELSMYDLSSLSEEELRLICQYFGLSYEKTATRKHLTKELSSFVPTVHVEMEPNGQHAQPSSICQRCAIVKVWHHVLVPASGSFSLKPVCRECLINLQTNQAEGWLKLGKSLLETDKKHLEAVLAMYRLSGEICPSEIAIIAEAKALFSCRQNTRVVIFGKDVLRKNTLQKNNAQILTYLVAESHLRIAQDWDGSELLEKADKYDETANWIENSGFCGDEKTRNIKLTAMKMRLDCFDKHKQAVETKAHVVFSHLLEAIRQGSLLKVFVVLQNDNREVMHLCFQRLSKESPDSYSQFSEMLLNLCHADAKLKQNDPTGAINQVADVFWNGYPLFQANEGDMHLVEYVIHFTCQLLKAKFSLPLEKLREVTVDNFLQCLQLTQDELLTPPDIESRKWPNVANVDGFNMKMFHKYEIAVKRLVKSKKWAPFDAALSYYDLVKASNHPSQILVTLITSAQWFARQMSVSRSKKVMQYWCKKMITRLTNLAAALAFEFGTHPYLQYYVARMVIGLQFSASIITGFGNQEDVERIAVHLKWLVSAGRHCPLHKIPIISPTEAVVMHLISQELHCDYILALQDEVPPELRPMSEAILRYQINENHLLRRCKLDDPDEKAIRLTAMTELLAEKKWSWEGVQRRLQSSMVGLDAEGWLVNNCKLSGPVASSGIQKLVGLEVNKKDFRIHLLVEERSYLPVINQKQPLLSWEDIATGVTMDQPESFFSLEAIEPQETPYHPFNKVIFHPEGLEGSQFLFSMFHADYLLKQLSMGFEIQSHPPFQQRPSSEGLLKDLPDYLKKALLPIPCRGFSRSRVHRLWIQADTIEYDQQQDEDSIRWLFGEVKVAARCMPMFHTEDGELKDLSTDGPDPDSPEGEFVSDFNKYYEQIGSHFPEFLRLKELCKVQFVGCFINSFNKALEDQKRKLESNEMNVEYRRMYLSNLQQGQETVRMSLDEWLREIKSQVSYINDDVVRQVQEQDAIPASNAEISHWLHTGDSSNIAQKIAREQVPSVAEIRQQVLRHHESNLKSFQSTVADLKKSSVICLSSAESANRCRWVPAVSHYEEKEKSVKLYYGGISLMPKALKVSMSIGKGIFTGIKKVLLRSGLLDSTSSVKQPPVKSFNPPRTRAAKPPADRRGDGSGRNRDPERDGSRRRRGSGGGGGNSGQGGKIFSNNSQNSYLL